MRADLHFVVRHWQACFQRMGNGFGVHGGGRGGGHANLVEYGAGWPEGNSPNPARTGSSRAKMKKRVQNCVAALFVWLMAVPVAPAQSSVSQLPAAAPSAVGLARIREAVETEIARKQLPGAVVLVGRQGKVVWRRAYGHRALEPQSESMTVDTIFDLASLTKVVATATSVMML